MTTNKPKVVVYRYTASRSFGKRNRKWHYQESFPHASNREVAEIGQMEELIRLSDYHALQAECDTLAEALESLMKGYATLLEGGIDRITHLDGSCCLISDMLQGAREALAAYRKQGGV